MKERIFKKKIKKRVFSVALALAMVVTLLPMNSVTVFAFEPGDLCECEHRFERHMDFAAEKDYCVDCCGDCVAGGFTLAGGSDPEVCGFCGHSFEDHQFNSIEGVETVMVCNGGCNPFNTPCVDKTWEECTTTYTVTFDLNGHALSTIIMPISGVVTGETITAPTEPTEEGYTFGGWYKEAECTNAWTFSLDEVTADTTLYAKWTVAHTCGSGVEQNGQAATCTEAGFKKYYKCGGCDKLYEEATCTTEITNLTTWKATGGNGNIPALGHNWGYSEDGATITASCSRKATCGQADVTLTLTATGSDYREIDNLANFNAATGNQIKKDDVRIAKVEGLNVTYGGVPVLGTPQDEGFYYGYLTVGNAVAKKPFKIGNPTIKVVSISFDKLWMYLPEGDSVTLIPTVLPEEAPNKTLSWTSSNTAVATVDQNGKVTAISKGETVITAESTDQSNKSAEISIYVKASSYVDISTYKVGDIAEYGEYVGSESEFYMFYNWERRECFFSTNGDDAEGFDKVGAVPELENRFTQTLGAEYTIVSDPRGGDPAPDGTNPDGTNPDGTNPDGTNPDGNNPDGTNPDGTNPDGTNPDGTTPDGTTPEEEPVKEIVTKPVYRVYNPNSGLHFYTVSEFEKDYLVSLGWNEEGIDFYAPEYGAAVYRAYNPANGDHYFTTSKAEIDALVANGWNDEGLAWYSDGELSVYKVKNPNAKKGQYFYTSNKKEYEYLVSLGWEDLGVAWKSMLTW